MVSCINTYLILAFIMFSFGATTTNAGPRSHEDAPSPSDKFIADPHSDPQLLPYLYMKVEDHPNYRMIENNAMMHFLSGSLYYCKVSGGSESSDINSVLYMIYSKLRKRNTSQYMGFFNSVVDENIARLAGSAHILQKNGKDDCFNQAKSIFEDVKMFMKLSPEQVSVLHKCVSYITASYIVDRANKIRIKHSDLAEEDEDRIAARELMLETARGVLGGQRPPRNIRLLAIQEKLYLRITIASMVGERARLNSLGFYSLKKLCASIFGRSRRAIMLLRYDDLVFSPIIIPHQ